MKELMDEYYATLNNSVTYDGELVDVFKEDAPEGQTTHFIELRGEGGSDNSNKTKFADDCVVIVDIVTIFQNNVDRSVVEAIDASVKALITSSPFEGNLSVTGKQVLNVTRETFTYITEQDDTNKYYRKVSRYVNRVLTT